MKNSIVVYTPHFINCFQCNKKAEIYYCEDRGLLCLNCGHCGYFKRLMEAKTLKDVMTKIIDLIN